MVVACAGWEARMAKLKPASRRASRSRATKANPLRGLWPVFSWCIEGVHDECPGDIGVECRCPCHEKLGRRGIIRPTRAETEAHPTMVMLRQCQADARAARKEAREDRIVERPKPVAKRKPAAAKRRRKKAS
jgi:hypothetical protein